MRTVKYSVTTLIEFFHKKKVLTMSEIKQALNTNAPMTINRKLNLIGYKTSYSHAGKYYTLDHIAQYDKNGLWDFNGIYFSRYGTLSKTIEHLIHVSESGYFASELKELLKLFVYNELLNLFKNKKINREQVGGEFLYLSIIIGDIQLKKRTEQIQHSVLKENKLSIVGYDSSNIDCLHNLLSVLNEKQRRLFLGFESMRLGYGGDTIMSNLTGIDVRTIARGRNELLSHEITPEKIRKKGSGRPGIKKKTEILIEIEKLLENDTAGTATNTLKWSRKSTRSISKQLRIKNIYICANTTGNLLKFMKYSLKVNRKMITETQHPDRNQQFEIISEMRHYFANLGQPSISVDSKKKELIGNFKNPGKIWTRFAAQVYNHDFRSQAIGIANPFGIYDIVANNGFVVVGTSYDTPEFAVESIELWLTTYGFSQYQDLLQLLILCDAGGSNGYRSRLWKYALYKKICCRYKIAITVCHYPSGASKWNPIDHRLFSFITMNWAGVPLRSYDIMLNCIRQTTTEKGLKVDAVLNEKKYEKGIKVTDDQMKEINIENYDHLPQWNYTIYPN